MGESTIAVSIYRPGERPSAFWAALGPHFASAKRRKELPYLADEPGRTWLVIGSPAESFASVDINRDVCRIREVWGQTQAQADIMAANLANLLEKERVKKSYATVTEQAACALETIGFSRTSRVGGHFKLERIDEPA